MSGGEIQKIEHKWTRGRPAVRVGITQKGLGEICEKRETNTENILQRIINTEDISLTEYSKELLNNSETNTPLIQKSPYNSIDYGDAKEISSVCRHTDVVYNPDDGWV